jgi:hypothetical protein
MKQDSTYSFLDVLACALGGTAMLFLLLTIMPHAGAIAKARPDRDISLIPASPTPRQGKETRVQTRLFRIQYPNCKLEAPAKPTSGNSKKIPGIVSLSVIDGMDANGMREAMVRISTNQNNDYFILKVRNCKSDQPFIISSLLNPGGEPTFILSSLNRDKLKYNKGRWK